MAHNVTDCIKTAVTLYVYLKVSRTISLYGEHRGNITEAERGALARYVVGIGSEGRHPGLGFAGNIKYDANGQPTNVSPVGNSGYTIGTMQWDFGIRKKAVGGFVLSIVDWASNPENNVSLTNEQISHMHSALEASGEELISENDKKTV